MNLIDRAELARRLGVSIEKLYRDLGDWMRHPVNPFPKPVLGRGRGERWDPEAIRRWVERGGFNPAAAGPQIAGEIAGEIDWAAQLDANAQTIARRT